MSDERSRAWQGHQEEQAHAWARLSYLERLRWLQGAKRFAKRATEAATRRRLADATGQPDTGAAPHEPVPHK